MKKLSFMKILVPVAALVLLMLVVIIERGGISLKEDSIRSVDKLTFTGNVTDESRVLVLVNKKDETDKAAAEEMELVLTNMKVKWTEGEIGRFNLKKGLAYYDYLILGSADWNLFDSDMGEVMSWVEKGGKMMNLRTPEPTATFLATAHNLGIINGGDHYTGITGLHLEGDAMIGAREKSSYSFMLEKGESLQTSLQVELDPSCRVYVKSEDKKVPLIWSLDRGRGRISVINDDLTAKYQRGFYCLAYTLLDDYSIYPVMNASAFYLDDFPSPVPEGNSKYIRRDYGLDTASFYSTIWWPTVMGWEKKYGIKHTGVIIEEYNDQVSGEYKRNPSTSLFLRNGNMLLNNGGELGYHGYNHQPLGLKGKDGDIQFGSYKLWSSMDAMKASLRELHDFSRNLFPTNSFQVYVPPSNIISENGLKAIRQETPNIKIIASSYLASSEEPAYVQEFGINKKTGFVDTPRITSGCQIDDYAMLTALSELNFQMVQSHFLHPDDAMDPDRGAAEGWEKMSSDFEKYLNFIYQSVPMIRNTTGSELGSATVAYTRLQMKREEKKRGISVRLGEFTGDQYFLLRVNDQRKKKLKTSHCTLKKITGDLYLVHTTSRNFSVLVGD